MSSTKRSQAPNQNPQVIDCTGKQCGKCGSALQPKTLPSGGTSCTCPNCDKTLMASKKEPCLSCHSKKINAQMEEESPDYNDRVEAYEEQGCTRSDAQGIVDAEIRKEELLNKGRKTAQMEKEVPVKVEPLDLEGGEDKGLDKVNPIGEEGDVVEPKPEAPPVDEGRNRVTKLLKDVEGLQNSITEYLESSYKISLTDLEKGELMEKILSAIASYVSTTTVDRVVGLSADILNLPVDDKRRK